MSTPIEQNTIDLQALLDQVNALPEASSGVELPELTNPGTSADLLSGKELIDQEGKVVTGTIATKTASNLTASGATVTVPAGYYASQATKSVATATQATPSISVNSSGLITASSTQSAGYVSSGTKSATKQLTTQAAKTITPSTSSQTAVAKNVYTTGVITVSAIPSTYVKPTTTKAATTYTPTTSNQTIAAGTYCSGAQTIKGDSNLKAENIAEGVSIFGVTGTHSGGSSGGANIETCTVTVSLVYEGSKYIYPDMKIACMQWIDGVISFGGTTNVYTGNTITIENVIRNSLFVMYVDRSSGSFAISACECDNMYEDDRYDNCVFLRAWDWGGNECSCTVYTT